METDFTELLDIKEINKLFATKLWVARDENGWLHIWFRKPHRAISFWIGEQIQDGWLEREEFVQNKHRLDDTLFPKLTWADEPIEVHLGSLQYSELVESKRKFDHDKIWEYCEHHCKGFLECVRESDGPCDFVKDKFEIKQ